MGEKRVGVIADTHGVFPDVVRGYLADVDEIWHLGDVFSQECFDEINKFREITHAVKGNWDNSEEMLEHDCFTYAGKKIFMIHKGFYKWEGKRGFSKGVWETINVEGIPDIILCGHTHRFDYCAMMDVVNYPLAKD